MYVNDLKEAKTKKRKKRQDGKGEQKNVEEMAEKTERKKDVKILPLTCGAHEGF